MSTRGWSGNILPGSVAPRSDQCCVASDGVSTDSPMEHVMFTLPRLLPQSMGGLMMGLYRYTMCRRFGIQILPGPRGRERARPAPSALAGATAHPAGVPGPLCCFDRTAPGPSESLDPSGGMVSVGARGKRRLGDRRSTLRRSPLALVALKTERCPLLREIIWGLGAGPVVGGLSGSGRRGPSPRPLPTATWLILPVVICLSQRLSHACLSITCLLL